MKRSEQAAVQRCEPISNRRFACHCLSCTEKIAQRERRRASAIFSAYVLSAFGFPLPQRKEQSICFMGYHASKLLSLYRLRRKVPQSFSFFIIAARLKFVERNVKPQVFVKRNEAEAQRQSRLTVHCEGICFIGDFVFIMRINVTLWNLGDGFICVSR